MWNQKRILHVPSLATLAFKDAVVRQIMVYQGAFRVSSIKSLALGQSKAPRLGCGAPIVTANMGLDPPQ